MLFQFLFFIFRELDYLLNVDIAKSKSFINPSAISIKQKSKVSIKHERMYLPHALFTQERQQICKEVIFTRSLGDMFMRLTFVKRFMAYCESFACVCVRYTITINLEFLRLIFHCLNIKIGK